MRMELHMCFKSALILRCQSFYVKACFGDMNLTNMWVMFIVRIDKKGITDVVKVKTGCKARQYAESVFYISFWYSHQCSENIFYHDVTYAVSFPLWRILFIILNWMSFRLNSNRHTLDTMHRHTITIVNEHNIQ